MCYLVRGLRFLPCDDVKITFLSLGRTTTLCVGSRFVFWMSTQRDRDENKHKHTNNS
jgi:hypothetical protein